ncbi:MAG: PKD domain-containing protein, partial [Methanosarcina sp.]|nr:PKD domain-containing protein [Methanosarcina sp.]
TFAAITVLEPVLPAANFTTNVTSGNAPLTVQFTDLSKNAEEWNWDFGDGAVSPEQNPAHTYSEAGNYTVTLTAANAIGTDSKITVITVLEQPEQPVLPVADFTSNITSGNAPLTVQFTDLSENAEEWNWDFGDGASSPEQKPAHTYSEAGTYTVSLTARNENGTNSKTDTITVLEQPEVVLPPVAGFTSSITRGSVPFSVQFTDLSENATGWKWDFGDGSVSSEQNPAHTYSAAGTYTVTLTVNNTAGTDTETRTGYIKVGIASSIKLTDLTLDGENSTGATTNSGAFTANPEDSFGQIGVRDENGIFFNQPSSISPLGKISIPLQLGINNFSLVADGFYPENENYGAVLFFDGVSVSPQVAVYNSNGGTGAFSVQPAGTDITGSAEGGSSLDKAPGSSFYVTPDGTKVEVLSFVLDSKKGLTDEVTGENLGANGVPDTIAKISLKVTPSVTVPLASFSASPVSGTAPLNVAFTDSSSGSPNSWNWDFGDGAVSPEQNPAHTYSGAGKYAATLTVSNANGTNSTFAAITVLEPVLPAANFTTNVTSGNAPLTVQFTDLSKNAEEWNWDFGDGAVSPEQNPAHTYSTAGNYTVSLTAANKNGTDSKINTIKVLEPPVLPVADFTTNVTSGNSPLTVQFTDLSVNAEEWNWDFGDGAVSPEQNPAHTYSTAGNYTVSLTAANKNGTDSKINTIKVLEPPVLPVADFTSNVTSGNAPLTVQFTDLSKNAEEWNWDFGDGTSSPEQKPAHTYSAAGNYTVSLTATNANGTDSKLAVITVLEQPAQPVPPVADFTSNITSGNAPLTVKFTDLSENAEEWNWDFGDGASSPEQHPAHTYSAAGNYTVSLTAANADGQSTKTGQISVNENPVDSSGNESSVDDSGN